MNGSIAHGEAQWPVAGTTGASGRAPAAGCAAATASARFSAASAPRGLTSRVAAKPHAPPTRTRTPMPSDSVGVDRVDEVVVHRQVLLDGVDVPRLRVGAVAGGAVDGLPEQVEHASHPRTLRRRGRAARRGRRRAG